MADESIIANYRSDGSITRRRILATEFDGNTFGWFWLCAFLLGFIPRSTDSWSLESNIDGLLVEFPHHAAVDVHRHGGGRCRERIQFLFILVTIYGVTDKFLPL